MISPDQNVIKIKDKPTFFNPGKPLGLFISKLYVHAEMELRAYNSNKYIYLVPQGKYGVFSGTLFRLELEKEKIQEILNAIESDVPLLIKKYLQKTAPMKSKANSNIPYVSLPIISLKLETLKNPPEKTDINTYIITTEEKATSKTKAYSYTNLILCIKSQDQKMTTAKFTRTSKSGNHWSTHILLTVTGEHKILITNTSYTSRDNMHFSLQRIAQNKKETLVTANAFIHKYNKLLNLISMVRSPEEIMKLLTSDNAIEKRIKEEIEEAKAKIEEKLKEETEGWMCKEI